MCVGVGGLCVSLGSGVRCKKEYLCVFGWGGGGC